MGGGVTGGPHPIYATNPTDWTHRNHELRTAKRLMMTGTPTPFDDEHDGPAGPYQHAAETYWRNGWHPLPVIGKAGNLPKGYTGHHGGPVDLQQVTEWIINRPNDNLALRLNGVIGIDIDNYTKDGHTKHGATTLQLAEAAWGPLPDTWRSTSRDGSNPSGIRFYRVPSGDLNLETRIQLPDPDTGELYGDIEVIQYSHRYAVVWPSLHPDTGQQYRWYTPDNLRAVLNLIPNTAELADLPQTWLDALTIPRTDTERPHTPAIPQEAPRRHWHTAVEDRYQEGIRVCNGAVGSRHDNMHRIVCALARDESRGRAGATTALSLLRDQFDLAIDGRDGLAEYDSMTSYARELVATTTSTGEQYETELRHMAEFIAGLPTPTPGPAPEPAAATIRQRLAPILARDLAQWVADNPAPEWQIQNFLACGGDDYGLISAEPKVGKTWIVGDLSVAVATGYPWLGKYPTRQGRVLVYIGEGGKRTAERRFQAIAESDHYQSKFGDLPIWVVEGVPHLAITEDERILRDAVQEIEPALVIIDPLYLAARGSDSRQLIEMGAVLETAQRVCQESGAALLFAHHWNKSGTGTGGARSTGAGPWEWARVSLSMRADGEATKTPESSGYMTVEQRLVVEVEGGNVIPTTLNLKRTISSLPGSLTAPITYRIDACDGYAEEAAKEDGESIRLSVLAVIRAHPKRCTLNDLYVENGPFRVAGRRRVEPVVKMMLRTGELVAVNYRHPDTQKVADRLDVGAGSLVAESRQNEQRARTTSGEDTA